MKALQLQSQKNEMERECEMGSVLGAEILLEEESLVIEMGSEFEEVVPRREEVMAKELESDQQFE